MSKIELPPDILAKFKRAAKKGGSAKSEAKTKACRENAKKPRRRKIIL